MRSFWRSSIGKANEPASTVEHAAASIAPTFITIEALNRWLKVQGDASTSLDIQRLRAATEVLTRKPKPRQEDVSLLCSSWIVRQYDQGPEAASTTCDFDHRVAASGHH
jgi:hypothetical protein